MVGTTTGPVLHLHIGLPKTASTWLQDVVFPRLAHMHVVTAPRGGPVRALPGHPAPGRLLHNALLRSSGLWSALGDEIMAHIFGEPPAKSDTILSDEAVGRQASHPERLAAHLGALARKSRDWGYVRMTILCLVRRQDHWLASHYAQLSNRKPRPGQSDFADLARAIADPGGLRYGFGTLLDYHMLHRHLAGLVGPDDLLILPYEMLANRPRDFLVRLLAHLDRHDSAEALAQAAPAERRNARGDAGSWRLRPRRLFSGAAGRGIALPSWAHRPGLIRLTDDLSRTILAAYATSNDAFAATAGLPLADYGYLAPDMPHG